MIEIGQTATFRNWFDGLDRRAQEVVLARLTRVETGNFGNTRSVGRGVTELKIKFGPGYRVYFTRQGNTVILLLCGGDKDSQDRDIKTAQRMVKELEG